MKKRIHRVIRTKTRIFILCFTIMFLFSSILLGMYCYSSSRKEIQIQLNSFQARFEQSVSNFQGQFGKLQEFASQLSEAGWFKELLYKRVFGKQISEEAYELHQYNSELKAYNLLNPFTEAMFIYFPGREYILSSTALFYGGKIPQNIFSLENIEAADWDEMTKGRNVSRYVPDVIVNRNKKMEKGMLFFNSYPFNNPDIRANLVIYITDEKMRHQVNPDLLEDAEFSIVRNGEVLWKSGEAKTDIPEDLSPEKTVQKFGDAWWFTAGEGIQKYYLKIGASRLDMGALYINFVLYYIFFIILCAAASAFLSKRIYCPLKNILDSALIPENYDTNMDEYRWLEREIGVLVDKEAVLRRRVEEQKPALMNAVLETILYGSKKEEEFEKLLTLLGISFPYRGYQVLTVEYDGEISYEEIGEKMRQLPREVCAVYYIFLKGTVAVIVNAEGAEVFERIREILFGCLSSCRQLQDGKYGAGEIVWTAGAMNHSFRHSVLAGKYQYFTERADGFLNAAATVGRNNFYQCTELEIKGLLFDLKNRQEEEACKKLDEILEHNNPKEKLTPEAAGKLLEKLWGAAAYFEKELALRDVEEAREEGSSVFRGGRKYSRAVAELKAYLMLISRKIEDKYDAGSQKLFQEILVFVDENMYHPELSLQMVAERFGYTLAYTSRIFKEHFNQNFLEYVMDGRIRKAKELLELTDLPIREISEKAGFGSDITFRRVFKRTTGMIPSNYRSLYQKK